MSIQIVAWVRDNRVDTLSRSTSSVTKKRPGRCLNSAEAQPKTTSQNGVISNDYITKALT